MAAERSVWVRLKASVSEFTGPMSQAKKAVEGVGTGAETASRKSNSALGGMAKSIRENGDAWTTVGGALSTYGAAVTGLSATVLGVGISYNTLQQTSRAALKTLTGSAEEANAQMDKLDAFARTSPFAKDIFIKAQQQLIGFGYAGEDVVPILDAIQNAVAAVGGSNEDIEALVGVIARIGTTGKISAEDLNQFGDRGIDAAEMIGEAFDMTGAQIREAITDGTLDADQAVQALTQSLSTNFEGAADNIKETMGGALDRAGAAFRDFASELATPLVNPDGGGLLIDWLNDIADALNGFRDLPGPVKTTISLLAGLSGVVALAAGGFMLMAPRVVETIDALRKLNILTPTSETRLKGIGKAAGIATAALIGLKILGEIGDMLFYTERDMAGLENQIRTLAGASEDLGTIFARTEWNEGFLDLPDPERADAMIESLERIADPSLFKQVDRWANSKLPNFLGELAASDDIDFANDLADIDTVLSQMAGESLPDATDAFNKWVDASGGGPELAQAYLDVLPGFREHLTGIANDMGIAATDTNLMKIATGELTPEVEGAGTAFALAEEEIDQYAESAKEGEEAIRDLLSAHESLVDEMSAGSSSFVDVMGAMDLYNDEIQAWAEADAEAYNKSIEKHNEWVAESGEGTKKATKTWEDFVDDYGFSMEEYLGHLEKMAEDQANWQSNLSSLVGRVSDDTLNHLAKLGPEGAPLIAELVNASEEELARFDAAFMQSGSGAGEAFADGLLGQQALYNAAARTLGDDAAAEIMDAVNSGEMSVAEAVLEWDLEAELIVDAWTDPAAQTVLDEVDRIEREEKAVVDVDANTKPGTSTFNPWFDKIDQSTAVVDIDADDTKGETVRKAFKWLADNTFGTIKLDADDDLAQGDLDTFFTNNSGRTIKVGMDYGFNSGGGMADGGIIQRANGGIDQAGNPIVRQSMMGGPQYGRTNILWGEPETGWEAYISGKPGQESRNRAVLEEAAHRMGMTVLDGLGTQRFANGGLTETMPTTMKFSGGPTGDGGIEQAMRDWLEHNPIAAGHLGMGWRAQWNTIKSLVPSAILTSAYRPGAITSSGYRSYHGRGRAVDLAGPMWQIFSILRQAFPQSRELYYSPAGFMQLQNGRPHYPTGITRAQHWDHVHWAMDKGGILDALLNPKAADTGMTTLNPGYNLRYNGLGRDEHMVDVERFRSGPMKLASEASAVTAYLAPEHVALLEQVADRPVSVQVDSREVAYANRRGEQSFGAPGSWSGAPRLGRSAR